MTKTLPLIALLSALLASGAALAQDAAAGEKKAATCIGCHGLPGFQASFPEVYRVPMIAGQNAKYLVASLEAYKKGERKHPTMRAIAGSLTEQDMADLAAFYEGQGAASARPVADAPAAVAAADVNALLTKGACASCHGANYNKPIDGAYPKVAGQPADYLYAALKSYQIEGNPRVGRRNAIMSAQVKPYKPADLKAMAAYLATLPGDVRVVQQAKFR